MTRPSRRVFHVTPTADLISHDEGSACICGPDVFEADDHGTPVLVVHHFSLAGTEAPRPGTAPSPEV